jgi:tetratricopeptide (TPR) repeat protein
MRAGAKLEDLRRRAAEATTAEEALDLNAEILAVDPDDGVAMNRLGRAYQDLGYIDDAIAFFTRALTVDPKNTIAQRRLRDLRLGKKRLADSSPGTARNIDVRDPAAALSVLDGAWRSACVALPADLLLFARRLDASRTIVRCPAGELLLCRRRCPRVRRTLARAHGLLRRQSRDRAERRRRCRCGGRTVPISNRAGSRPRLASS